jgi:methionyl-tRNA formyltransferase
MKTMISFAFFGTSRFSVILLEELMARGISPSLIVTAPDRPVGRKQILTPPPVKVWAEKYAIPVLQPEKLKDRSFLEQLKPFTLFIVASYGKIIPKDILDLPSLGTLNVHPSLLPKYRGASPIQNQILNNEQHVGTTIMAMDEEMDHGPIVSQREITFTPDTFPATYHAVEEKLAKESAQLLTDILPSWIDRSAIATLQEHAAATYTKIIEKADGEISFSDDPFKNYLKYLAYSEWPKTFFFFEKENKKMRAVITSATFEEGVFVIKKVIPEGRKEMSYEEFNMWLQQTL